jgi:hypothetical protein
LISVFLGENMEQSSEAAPHVQVKLKDIPENLLHKSTTYVLREVLNYYKGKSQLRNSIGHYTAYYKREERNWELYDDLKKKTKRYLRKYGGCM